MKQRPTSTTGRPQPCPAEPVSLAATVYSLWYRWLLMSPLHVRSKVGEVAPFVLLPGDPDRATLIAERFFDNPRQTTSYRHLYGYTGSYKGMPVSVQTTGMGCPSLAIVVEELITIGARSLVRVGTAGTIASNVNPGDLIIAEASVPADGTTRAYLHGEPHAPTATFAITRAMVEAAERLGRRPHVGLIQTEDAFYLTTPEDVPRLASRGVLAIEMEASALFTIGALRGVDTGCLVVASNRIGDDTFVDPEILTRGVVQMVETALEGALSLHLAEST